MDYMDLLLKSPDVTLAMLTRKRPRFPAAEVSSIVPWSRRWSDAVIGEEAQHFARGIRSARIGVGAGRAAARPGVTGSLDRPMLAQRLAGGIGVDGAAVGSAAGRLTLLDRRPQSRRGRRGLRYHGLTVARMDGGVLVAMKDDGRDGSGAVTSHGCPLAHGGEGGGNVTGGPDGQTGMHPDGGVEVGICGTHDGGGG